MYDSVLKIYHDEIPDFLKKLIYTPPIERLKGIGMNCGCEYTSFPIHSGCETYKRFEHSLGVALIAWHFSRSKEAAIAGLLHDISSPTFAHSIDFFNGDYDTQEYTERNTLKIICDSPVICREINELGISINNVSDSHRYSIVDNKFPQLSADRLEYNFGHLLSRNKVCLDDIKYIYSKIVIVTNEYGKSELAFSDVESALFFTRLSLINSRIFTSPEDRFSMYYLSELLKKAIVLGAIGYNDLYSTEQLLINKLKSNCETKKMWNYYSALQSVDSASTPDNKHNWIRITTKKRYIDPLVIGKGRITDLVPDIKQEIYELCHSCFLDWICIPKKV